MLISKAILVTPGERTAVVNNAGTDGTNGAVVTETDKTQAGYQNGAANADSNGGAGGKASLLSVKCVKIIIKRYWKLKPGDLLPAAVL